MILTTFIILILMGCFINGHRRGLLTMTLMLGTYIVAWIVARQGAQLIGSWLKLLLPSIGTPATFSESLLANVNSNLFVVLLIMQLFPAGWWQMQIANSELARFMINQTPGIAHLVIDTLVQGG